MKFSTVFVLASVLVSEAIAQPFVGQAPSGSLHRRAAQNKFGNKGGFGKGGFGGNTGNKNTSTAKAATGAKTTAAANKASTSAAAASTTTASAAASGNGKAAAAGAAGAAAGAGAGAAAASGKNNNNNNAAANNGGGDLQTSLTLDPNLIGSNLAQDGLGANGTEAGQVASLTTTNNFINFCDTVKVPITNGLQIAGGSCNPVPMGVIPAKQNVPSCKFVFPPNGGTVAAKTTFTIQLAVRNMETGNFVNPNTNYFGGPQQVGSSGFIVAHGHVVVEKLSSLGQTTPTDPTVFAFFKGLNAKAVNGILSADVTGGLDAGFYKVSSINTAANHQPVLGPVAQHGSFDDVSYFEVK